MATNQGFKSLVLRGGIVPEYIRYYLLSAKEYAQSLSSGTTFKELSGARMAALSMPVAPITEQRRIVAKLDGLLGRTARARKELDHVPMLVARYKQAVLTSAFSGELTKEWRAFVRDVSTAAAVVESIRSNRADQGALGRRKRVLKKPDFTIPQSWAWISPDETASDAAYSIGIGPFGSNLVRSDYEDHGVRLVFVRDIRRARFDETHAKYISRRKAEELHQHVVTGGEVLITKMGDPPGDTALYPSGIGSAVITSDCIKLRPHPAIATASYLVHCIRSEIVRTQIAEITMGVAHQKVSLDRFRQIALPIPPLDEQEEIVRRIEAAFAWLDKLAAEHARASALLPKLEQALLARAFRGELVPQDPNDEPASALLERIRAARAVAPERKRKLRPSQLPRAPRQRAAMTKNRLDQDVMHQPYLAKHLRDAGGSAKVEDLFRSADLPVTDFYKQLAWEVEAGHVNDQGALLEAA